MESGHRFKYIVINDESQNKATRDSLRKPAEPFAFPLSKDDLESINSLKQVFLEEQKIAGLAAPQIGIKKQAIIFQVLPEIKKWRQDFTHPVSTTIWLNPSYQPIGDGLREDYEGCFSVCEMAGKIPRFIKIKYTAYDINGDKLEGIAEGYLARILQHEIDHLRGVLFIDKISPDQVLTMGEYMRLRDAKMGS